MHKLIAMLLVVPRVQTWLLQLAILTPYFHLDGYMLRWWLVPYEDPEAGLGCGKLDWRRRPVARFIQKLGYAMRIQLILRADNARHPHDHPWDARTYLLAGAYVDDRTHVGAWGQVFVIQHYRTAGDTATLKYGEYHHLSWVHPEGALTLFVTGRYKGWWGFLVNGVKVPWREYERLYGTQ